MINATFSLKLMCCWGLCTSHMEILLQASLYFNIEHIRDLSHTHTHARNLLQTVRESEKMHMFIILYECDNQLYIVMVHFKNCFTKAGFILLFLWIGFSPVFCLFNSSIGSVDCIHIHTRAWCIAIFVSFMLISFHTLPGSCIVTPCTVPFGMVLLGLKMDTFFFFGKLGPVWAFVWEQKVQGTSEHCTIMRHCQCLTPHHLEAVARSVTAVKENKGSWFRYVGAAPAPGQDRSHSWGLGPVHFMYVLYVHCIQSKVKLKPYTVLCFRGKWCIYCTLINKMATYIKSFENYDLKKKNQIFAVWTLKHRKLLV